MPSKQSKISERAKADRRKMYREGLFILENEMKNIKDRQQSGNPLRDQQLRFLDHYPETRKKYEMLIADSLEKDKGLPEGKLKEFVDRIEWMESVGSLEEVIESSGYYRCDKCGELHTKSRKCMYEEYQEMVKSDSESEELEDNDS